MLFITLIRHAKSSWDELDCDDFDRPLNKRGFRDAPNVAAAVQTLGCHPQHILTSPSKRTLQTLDCFVKAGAFGNATIASTDSIYEASSGELIELVSEQSDAKKSIAIIGHNPGLTNLAEELSGINIRNLPTCGVAMIGTEASKWSDIRHSDCKLLLLVTPKGIASKQSN